ncbi:MAG TPA: hypothetical protein VH120_15390, partial [Gemmataceae bacterium]|nr:hypothetical protein [Gemmataceae bacterium]
PLTLVFMNGVKDAAATRLPDGVLRTICPGWELGLAAPQHAAVQLLLQAVSFPLVLGELLTDAGEPITAANNAAVSEAAVLVDDTSTPDSKEATVVEVHRDKWVIRREGAIPTAEVGRLAAMSVLFVCTGNTCRSPLAAALCRKQLADRLGCTADELPARGYVVASAGLAAMRDEPAAAEAVAVAGELGADLTGHASRPATPDVLDKADLIVGMTAGHLGGLDGIVGRDVRTRLLCGESDLADPIGGDLLVYQTCAGTIWQHLPGLVEELAGGER